MSLKGFANSRIRLPGSISIYYRWHPSSAMAPVQTITQAQGRVKYKGIHEPKGRVKGFRVEIRPSGSSTKIWVGTFDSRGKAMRAFDAAVYFTGKEPYYFVYPENFFPPRTPNLSKEDVQRRAKEYAEKTGDLKMNEAQFLVGHAKVSSVEAPKKLAPCVEVKKPVEQLKEEFKQLDENLQNAVYVDVPNELPLDSNHDWISWWMSEQSVQSVEDSDALSEKAIAAAYYRGLSDPQDWTTTLLSLSGIELLKPEDYPFIDSGGSSFDFKSALPQDVDLKWKREASEGAHDIKTVCYRADTIDAAAADIVTTEGFFTDFDMPLPHHVSLKRKLDASEGACDCKRVAISRDAVSADAATTTVAGDDWTDNLFENLFDYCNYSSP